MSLNIQGEVGLFLHFGDIRFKLTCQRLAANTSNEGCSRGRSTACKYLEYRCVVCEGRKEGS